MPSQRSPPSGSPHGSSGRSSPAPGRWRRQQLVECLDQLALEVREVVVTDPVGVVGSVRVGFALSSVTPSVSPSASRRSLSAPSHASAPPRRVRSASAVRREHLERLECVLERAPLAGASRSRSSASGSEGARPGRAAGRCLGTSVTARLERVEGGSRSCRGRVRRSARSSGGQMEREVAVAGLRRMRRRGRRLISPAPSSPRARGDGVGRRRSRRAPGPGRDDGAAAVVDVEHQLGRLLLRVAEELLEDVGDVGHQVDRVVPDDDEPRLVDVERSRSRVDPLTEVGDDLGGRDRAPSPRRDRVIARSRRCGDGQVRALDAIAGARRRLRSGSAVDVEAR